MPIVVEGSAVPLHSIGGHPRLDIPGVGLATTGLFGITWAVVRTNTAGWGSSEVIATLIAGLAVVGLFVLWERRTTHPMLSLAMFRQPSFAAANGISFCLFAGLFGALFLMSQFLQTAQGRSPLQAGTELLVWSATGLFVAPIADRYGNRPFMLAGLVMQTAGLACLAIIARTHTPSWRWPRCNDRVSGGQMADHRRVRRKSGGPERRARAIGPWLQVKDPAAAGHARRAPAWQRCCDLRPGKRKSEMMKHKVATREEWLAARNQLLAKEKEWTRRGDQLAAERRNLPWVPIEKEYRFGTDNGPKTLPELFDGRSQLIVYHFMFGPSYTVGCPTCSSAADTFNGAVPHLNARDVTFTCISRAPLDKLQAYKRRMGWSFPWASSDGNDYNFDLEISRPEEATRELLAGGVPPVAAELAEQCGTGPAAYLSEEPVMSTYALEDGTACLTYSTTARGLEFMMAYYGFLDRAPLGRNEGDAPMRWLRRHDEYGTRT